MGEGAQYTIPTRAWENVAASQRAILQVDKAKTIHQLDIDYGALDLADLESLRLMIDESLHWDLGSGEEIDSFNQFEGRDAASGILKIDFERYGITIPVNRELTALCYGLRGDPVDIKLITLEVQLSSTASPTLKSVQLISSPQFFGKIKKYKRSTLPCSGAGEFEFNKFKMGETINKIWLKNASSVTKVEVWRDGFKIFDRTPTQNNLYQSDGRIRVPQSGYFVIDTTERGDGSRTWGTAKDTDLVLKLTVSGATTPTAIVEYIGDREVAAA